MYIEANTTVGAVSILLTQFISMGTYADDPLALLHLRLCLRTMVWSGVMELHTTTWRPLCSWSNFRRWIWLLSSGSWDAVLALPSLFHAHQCDIRRHLHMRDHRLRLCIGRIVLHGTRCNTDWRILRGCMRCLFLCRGYTGLVFALCDHDSGYGVAAAGPPGVRSQYCGEGEIEVEARVVNNEGNGD
jgi:hypothetical protein